MSSSSKSGKVWNIFPIWRPCSALFIRSEYTCTFLLLFFFFTVLGRLVLDPFVGFLSRLFVLNKYFVLLFFSSFLNLFVSFCYIRQLSVFGVTRMPCKLCINSNTFGNWFWSSCHSRICLTNHFWCCCLYQFPGLWKWHPVLYLYLLNLFVHFPLWALSRVCTVVTFAVGANNVVDTCLVVMVKLTATSAFQLASTCIMSMSKALAFKATQGIRNKWFNRYVKVTCFDRCRKNWNIKCKDKGIRW